MKPLYQNIPIPKTTGKKLIKDQKKLFNYIDSDFEGYGANKIGTPQDKTDLAVLELTENMTFKQMFTNPEGMALTQEQIIFFIENNKDKLRDDGYATFFLFKSGTAFFVANVDVNSDGLRVYVCRFVHDGVWGAERRRRVVVPQLEIKALIPSDTEILEPFVPSALTDEQAIAHLKAQGYKITRLEEKEY